MRKSATELRAQLYDLLDHVAKTGEPVRVTRHGVELCIVRKDAVAAKAKRRKRTLPDLVVGDPDDLVHIEWRNDQLRR